MALTVGEPKDALDNLDPKYWSKAVIAYHDVEFKVSGVELNFDTDESGDALLVLED